MERKGLELLFDYTKFHIGIYLTLAAAAITLGTAKFSGGTFPTLNTYFIWPAVLSIAIAGFSGGIVVSSITQTETTNVKEFLTEETGPWNIKRVRVLKWIYLEHTAFWVGIAFVLLSFAFRK